MVSEYILKEQRQVYGDTVVTEVDWATGSIYSGDPWVDWHHLIVAYNEYTHSIFPTFCGISWIDAIVWILNAG